MTPRKPNQPQLTREQIVSATMKLIDEHGLERHSMRQLGAELGVDPSTVYYHVPSKAELYSLIADEIMSGVDMSIDDPTLPFEERMVAAAQAYRSALLVHPKAVPLMAARSLRTPAQLRAVEVLLRVFFDAGFDGTEAITAVDVFGMSVLGMAGAEAAHIVHSEYRAGNEEFGELPPAQFPNLTRVFAQARYIGFEAEFQTAIRSMARGLLDLHESGRLVPPPDASPSTLAAAEASDRTRARVAKARKASSKGDEK